MLLSFLQHILSLAGPAYSKHVSPRGSRMLCNPRTYELDDSLSCIYNQGLTFSPLFLLLFSVVMDRLMSSASQNVLGKSPAFSSYMRHTSRLKESASKTYRQCTIHFVRWIRSQSSVDFYIPNRINILHRSNVAILILIHMQSPKSCCPGSQSFVHLILMVYPLVL